MIGPKKYIFLFTFLIILVLAACGGADISSELRDTSNGDLSNEQSDISFVASTEWFEIPDSHMASVVPVPMPPGRANQAGIMTAWSGGAWDSNRNRLIVWGGGHSDGGDNSIYTFDVDDLQWSRAFTVGSNENGYYSSCTDNPDLNLPTNMTATAYPDGSPIVYHTYDALQYYPPTDTFYAFANRTHHRCGGEMSDGRVHKYNFTTDTWQTLASPGVNWGSVENASAYDSATNKMWLFGMFGRLVEYDIATNTANDHGSYPMLRGVIEVDEKNRRLVGVSASKVWTRDLVTGKSIHNVETVGGPVTITESPGLVYDTVLEKIVLWSNGTSLWSLNTDPAGTADDPWIWTEHPATDGTLTTEPGLQALANGTFGRFQYSEKYNSYIVVNGTTENVWMASLSGPPVLNQPTDKPAKINRAGSDFFFPTLSSAFSALADGDTLTIKDGVYPGPWTITENNITIQAENKRGVELTNSASVSHGIINYSGDNVTIDGIVFKDAFNGTNAAGIWANAGYGDLTVKNCTFDNNDNGILTGSNTNGDADILIESSEFKYNGTGSGQAHQMYIGGASTLTVRYCYIHNGNSGQSIKSRAWENYILYNRITDETDGNYNIDLPSGGESWIVGNIIEQGDGSDNEVMMTYGVEAYWVLRIKNGGMTEPRSRNRIIGRTSGAECLIPRDRFCQVDCPGEGTGSYATKDRATGIQCWHYSGVADPTPDWIPEEILDLYAFDGTSLIEDGWAQVRSASDPPTYLPSQWKPPFEDKVNRLYLVNNSIINNKTNVPSNKSLIHLHVATELFQMTNNIIYSDPRASWTLLRNDYGANISFEDANIHTTDSAIFTDLANYDVEIDQSHPDILGQPWQAELIYDGFDATPVQNYVHPYGYSSRSAVGLGALW